jgi:hypothetical protein
MHWKTASERIKNKIIYKEHEAIYYTMIYYSTIFLDQIHWLMYRPAYKHALVSTSHASFEKEKYTIFEENIGFEQISIRGLIWYDLCVFSYSQFFLWLGHYRCVWGVGWLILRITCVYRAFILLYHIIR